MIGYLRGLLIKSSPGVVVVDVQGVGYEVRVSLSTFGEIDRQSPENTLALHIHTHVRDDAIELYGFWTEQERALFEKLIGVSGIGPRLAQGALSGMAPDEIVQALATGDVARLTRIPGIGKKTAERLVLELKEAAQRLASESAVEPPRNAQNDLVLALVNLGYRQAEAESAVAMAQKENPQATFQELLRTSLRRLSRL